MGVITKTLEGGLKIQIGGGGLKIQILKVNGRSKKKGMCQKEQQICQSNCLEFIWDFMLNKYQCL